MKVSKIVLQFSSLTLLLVACGVAEPRPLEYERGTAADGDPTRPPSSSASHRRAASDQRPDGRSDDAEDRDEPAEAFAKPHIPGRYPQLGALAHARGLWGLVEEENNEAKAKVGWVSAESLLLLEGRDDTGANWIAEDRHYLVKLFDEESGEGLEVRLPELDVRAYDLRAGDGELVFFSAEGEAFTSMGAGNAKLEILGQSEDAVWARFSGRLCSTERGAGRCLAIEHGRFSAVIERIDLGANRAEVQNRQGR